MIRRDRKEMVETACEVWGKDQFESTDGTISREFSVLGLTLGTGETIEEMEFVLLVLRR